MRNDSIISYVEKFIKIDSNLDMYDSNTNNLTQIEKEYLLELINNNNNIFYLKENLLDRICKLNLIYLSYFLLNNPGSNIVYLPLGTIENLLLLENLKIIIKNNNIFQINTGNSYLLHFSNGSTIHLVNSILNIDFSNLNYDLVYIESFLDYEKNSIELYLNIIEKYDSIKWILPINYNISEEILLPEIWKFI